MPYLNKLVAHAEKERDQLFEELRELRGRVDHIKKVIGQQQAHARGVDVTERVHVSELIDEAIALADLPQDMVIIDVANDLPRTWLDRHQALQILVNLLHNAVDAVEQSGNSERQIRVDASTSGSEGLRLRVRDNGVGIQDGDLDKIFNHGYTTKENGNGFGLHNAANTAKRMGVASPVPARVLGAGRHLH